MQIAICSPDLFLDPFVEKDEPYTLQKDIECFLKNDSFDPVYVKEILYSKYPDLKNFIETILSLAPEHTHYRTPLIQALCVIVGIKPALVIEASRDRNKQLFIRALIEKFPHISVHEEEGHLYITNESPLKEFDPQTFIQDFSSHHASIMEGVVWWFPELKSRSAEDRGYRDQFLSYLLGFGPSWEEYALFYAFKVYDQKKCIPPFTILTDAHYSMLGRVITVSQNEEDQIAAGKKAACDIFRAFQVNLARKQALAAEGKRDIYQHPPTQEESIAAALYMDQRVGPISFYTEYIQKGIAYRAKLFTLFDLPLRSL